tara:strand:- start:255 stop:656 length:402 start_codon:yes stop_codon:yes gene_type:complete
MDWESSYYIICSGVISGIILFQSSVIAPTVFKTLGPDDTSIFLRKVFPKMFSNIFAFGLLSLLLALKNNQTDTIQMYTSMYTVIGSALCYSIIPATNKATDEKKIKRFKILHTVSVVVTLSILFVNVFWIFFV